MDTTKNYAGVFADLTRTRFGMERNVVNLLRDLCRDYEVDRGAVFVVTDDRHQALVDKELPGATIVVSRPNGAKPLISSRMKGLKEKGPFLLVSYGRDVLELENEDQRFHALSFGKYREQRRRLTFGRDTPTALASAVQSSLAAEALDAVPVAPEPLQAEIEPKCEPQHRSRFFGEILVKQKLGPFADHRGLVYDAIEAIVGSSAKCCVTDLLDRAVEAARAQADVRYRQGTDHPKSSSQDGSVKRMDPKLWNVIRKFIEQIVLGARVLMTEAGEPIGRDWRSRSQTVAGLADGWRAAVDGQLILGLVAERNDITSLDGRNIARAIYHSSSEEAERRVNEAVIYLLDNRVLEESKVDGALRRVPEETRIRAVS